LDITRKASLGCRASAVGGQVRRGCAIHGVAADDLPDPPL